MGGRSYSTFILVGLLLVIFFSFYFFNVRKNLIAPSANLIEEFKANGVPEVKMATMEGREFSLKEFEKQNPDVVIIVNFWASWCAPCVSEFPAMLKLLNLFQGKLKMIAISADERKDDVEHFLRAFEGASNPNLIVLWDKESTRLRQSYGTDKLPESFIISQGKLIMKVTGGIDWAGSDVTSRIKGLIRE